jgi:O-acetyl-ADP-ribose deacetylase (regulator of RNase III)
MITNINGNILDSKANFIVHKVNSFSLDSNIASQIVERYEHIEKEYLKYLRYCNKNHYDIIGSVQFVPVEPWALIMVDTMKNNNVIDYDTNYQYIVNMFCESSSDEGIKTNLKAAKKALENIFEKAKNIGATVAIPDNIEKLVREIIAKYDVDVEVWR